MRFHHSTYTVSEGMPYDAGHMFSRHVYSLTKNTNQPNRSVGSNTSNTYSTANT